MKSLFLLLLAVNIGLFAWGYQREQAAEHKKPRVYADVGELRLLSEQKVTLDPESTQGLMVTQNPAQNTTETAQDLMDLMVVAASDPDPGLPNQLGPAAEQVVLSKTEMDEGSQLIQPVVDKSDPYIQQNNAQIDKTGEIDAVVAEVDESITEISKPKKQETEIEQESQENIAMEPSLLPLTPICYQLGPIADAVTIEGLSSNISQLGLGVVIQKERITKAKGYWVIYPPQKTFAQAKQKLNELKKVGLSDLWLFPKGKYKNAISLGLYSQRVNADAAHKLALKKGVITEVLVRYVEVDQHWLQFHSAEQPAIAKESIFALQEAYPDEKIEIKPCSSVVTE